MSAEETVFFSDLASFTELTDKLESEDLTNLLNRGLKLRGEGSLPLAAARPFGAGPKGQ